MATAVSTTSSLHLQAFDKGLRSRALGDQLSTITTTASLMDDNPFPMFINQIVVRLAEAFRDGSNELRLCVARVLADCAAHLSLVFSGQEILKRILLVSHSNDPDARALTLEILASLVPIFPDNKQVHHLIVESLGTDNDFEFKSASHAMASFAQMSTEFSATIIQQLSTLLLSPDISLERKALLIPVFAKMRATVATTQEVFALSAQILETCTQNDLICSLLDAMTTLAEATRYAIPDQLSVLLACASRCDTNPALAVSALVNLRRLATHAHVWNTQHLDLMQSLRVSLECFPTAFRIYLLVLIDLSSKTRPAHHKFFDEVVVKLGHLSVSPDMSLRIKYLHIGSNVFCSQSSDALALSLIDAFACLIGTELPINLSKKFHHILGQFMTSPSLPENYFSSLLSPLLQLPSSHSNLSELAQLLCLLTDRMPSVVEVVKAWATRMVNERSDLPISLFSFLLLPPGLNMDLQDPISTVAPGNDSVKYSVARVAFRNGHWKAAALPNLEAITTTNLSLECSLWISALRSLAASQLSECTVKELEQQRDHLLETNSTLKTLLATTDTPSAFHLPSRLVNCLLVSSRAVHEILSGVSPFLRLPQQLGSKASAVRVKNLLSSCAVSLNKACITWTELARCSFGADAQSLDCLSLLHTMYTVIHQGLLTLCGDTSKSAVMMPVVSVETTNTKTFLQLISWANAQIAQLQTGVISEKSLVLFVTVLKSVCTHHIPIPRIMFHQQYTMDIKLALISGTNGELNVGCNQLVPIQLDGVISSSHPAHVESLTVIARITHTSTQGKNTLHSQTVRPTDNIYFTTQFLLQFRQSCQIDFSVEFVDGDKRQQWTSTSTASLKILIHE